MSDTPRTDALADKLWGRVGTTFQSYEMLLEHAKKLEREAGFWRKSNDAWEAKAMNALACMADLAVMIRRLASKVGQLSDKQPQEVVKQAMSLLDRYNLQGATLRRDHQSAA